jgi:four helix bundle protein
MTYQHFEDLPVWQEAMPLAHGVYDLTENSRFRISFSLRDQIERSSMSVSDNIAEGFERGTTSELLAFIYIARGSAGETRFKLCFMEKRLRLGNFKSEISNLKSIAISCSKQLRAWADHLQNSDIKGQCHLSDQSRRESEQRKRAAAFNEELLGKLPPTHPLRVAKQKRVNLKSQI